MIRGTPGSTPFPYTTLFRSRARPVRGDRAARARGVRPEGHALDRHRGDRAPRPDRPHLLRRSEEHTSELQSPCKLVCRLQLEKKNSSFSAIAMTRETTLNRE